MRCTMMSKNYGGKYISSSHSMNDLLIYLKAVALRDRHLGDGVEEVTEAQHRLPDPWSH
jgi:hypothetical protein